MSGWIKLHRSLKDWCYYSDNNMVKALVHCVISANHKPKKWRDITINSGQFVTSIRNFSKETGLTEKQTRLCWKKLEKCGETTSKRTNKYTVITLLKWSELQVIENDEGQTGGHSKGNQRATNKNEKNEKKNKYDWFISKFNELTKRKFKGSNKVKQQLNQRIKEGYTGNDFMEAIQNAMKDDYIYPKYLTPEYITRSNILDKWLNTPDVKRPRQANDIENILR